MAHGLEVFVDGNEILFTKGVFNPIWSIRLYNIGNRTINVSLPAGEGDIVYTTSQERPVDQSFSMGGSAGSLDTITLGDNSATLVTTAVSGGFNEFYVTFYRRRP